MVSKCPARHVAADVTAKAGPGAHNTDLVPRPGALTAHTAGDKNMRRAGFFRIRPGWRGVDAGFSARLSPRLDVPGLVCGQVGDLRSNPVRETELRVVPLYLRRPIRAGVLL